MSTVRLGWSLVFGLTLIFTLLNGTSLPVSIQYLPMLASVIILGLPHGAIDHLVPFRLLRRPISVGAMSLFITGYVGLVGLYAFIWMRAPGLAFIGFLLMTWLHWGQGDLHFVKHEMGGDHIRTGVSSAMAVFVRGGLPMVIPIVLYPEVVQSLAITIAELVGKDSGSAVALLVSQPVRVALGIGFLSVATTYFVLTYRQHDVPKADWQLDLFEVILLALFFTLVPPWIAIGLYFCIWHSLRHIHRLILLDPQRKQQIENGRWLTAVTGFSREAMPMTAAAIGILSIVVILQPISLTSLERFAGTYLALIAALTFPHFLLVSWMDWRN